MIFKVLFRHCNFITLKKNFCENKVFLWITLEMQVKLFLFFLISQTLEYLLKFNGLIFRGVSSQRHFTLILD